MPKYQVLIAESVEKYLDKLDRVERNRIIKRLWLLEENPKSVGEPSGNFWILMVGRAGYRAAFRIIEEEKKEKVTAIEQRKSRKYEEFYQ
jgi:mRNA-degrading endonuclease RelE of RelBE toxin-antitoxin system